jgi:ankyrin repeat protein
VCHSDQGNTSSLFHQDNLANTLLAPLHRHRWHCHLYDTRLQEGSHLAVAERLIAAGTDVNASERYKGKTALQAAARGGHLAVVELLLKANANVNAPAARFAGRTAIQAAAEGSHLAVVNRLLEAKAEVNAESSRFVPTTALQAAEAGGHVAVVKRLKQSGAIQITKHPENAPPFGFPSITS